MEPLRRGGVVVAPHGCNAPARSERVSFPPECGVGVRNVGGFVRNENKGTFSHFSFLMGGCTTNDNPPPSPLPRGGTRTFGSTIYCRTGCTVMAVTGQIFSHAIQTTSQGVLTAMVSKGVVKPGGKGQTPTHAPHLRHAFQLISKVTGGRLGIGYTFR
jgi:hypothetical protein